jgi:hypothetical protein
MNCTAKKASSMPTEKFDTDLNDVEGLALEILRSNRQE